MRQLLAVTAKVGWRLCEDCVAQRSAVADRQYQAGTGAGIAVFEQQSAVVQLGDLTGKIEPKAGAFLTGVRPRQGKKRSNTRSPT